MPFKLPRIKSFKDSVNFGVVIFLILGIIVGVILALQPQIFNKKASEDSVLDIKFAPEILNIKKGGIYETKIVINPKSNRVTAVKLQISYDPEIFSVLSSENLGFLPVTLKAEDSHQGRLTLIYASTIESDTSKPGTIALIKLKALNPKTSVIEFLPESEVNISTSEENALSFYPKLIVEPSDPEASQEPEKYPDNLLLEKAFFASSEPFIRDFGESLNPKPKIGPDRIEPEFSMAYAGQLGNDILINPIIALNEVIAKKVGEVFTQ